MRSTVARLATPLGTPGALAFYAGAPQEHLALARHLTAETKIEEFIPGKGLLTRWERVRRQNHWFDTLYNASAAVYHAGIRLLPPQHKAPGAAGQAPPRTSARPGLTHPDGRSWIDTGRWLESTQRFGG